MKNILFVVGLLLHVFAVKAQESSVDEYQNEFLPSMNSLQRVSLKPFEMLRVIDTDEKRTWIYKNGSWQKEFTDEAIKLAKLAISELLNSNESWREFDEMSKPELSSQVGSTDLSVEVVETTKKVSNSKTVFRYETLTADEISASKILLKATPLEKLAFVKIYMDSSVEVEIEGFSNYTFKERNSILIRPVEVQSDKQSFSLRNQDIFQDNSKSIRGILIAYATMN